MTDTQTDDKVTNPVVFFDIALGGKEIVTMINIHLSFFTLFLFLSGIFSCTPYIILIANNAPSLRIHPSLAAT